MKDIAPFSLVLFDLDGVIVDTAGYHFLAWKKLAATLGYNLTEQKNRALKGVGRKASLMLISKWAGINLSEEEVVKLTNAKNEWYITSIENLSPADILPGATKLLDDLKANDIKVGIGSSSKNAKKILQKLGITGYFDVIVDGTMITHTKPHPEVFITGATTLGIPPERTVVFEDAESGVQAALAGGMYAIGVGGNNLSAAHYVVPNLKSCSYKQLEEKLINMIQ